MDTKLGTALSEHANQVKEKSEILIPESVVERKSILRLDEPNKIETDPKKYRVLQLKNGMNVLLIEDNANQSIKDIVKKSNIIRKKSEKELIRPIIDDDNSSAVCLMVYVGGFSDPSNICGLAHFLEHMIFMGSEEYPSECEFLSYIESHGGYANASTQRQTTMFQFKIDTDYLDGALKRLSAFFTAPLMKRNTIDNERKVIDSEFQMTLQNDRWRKIHVLSALANPKHPISKFTCGNMKSLKDQIDDETLYRKVKEFRERHYSAHRMYLCVQSKFNINDTEKIVAKHFLKIKNNGLPEDDFSQFNHRNAFKEEYFTHVLCIKAIEDTRRICLTWTFPSIASDYKCKPHHYISYLLSRKDKGSLCAYLRNKLWARNVFTELYDENSILSLFEICIDVTEDGLNHITEVLEATFSYIKFVEEYAIDEEAYNELKQIVSTAYRFRKEKDPYENVQHLVMNLKYFSPKDILFGSELYYEFDDKEIQKIIRLFGRENFNITIMTKKKFNNIEFNRKEKWYGVQYALFEIPQKWKDIWRGRKLNSIFSLPRRNHFITKDFSILFKSGQTKSNHSIHHISKQPRKIYENDFSELWYREDDKFFLPQAYIYMHLITPMPLESSTNAVLLTLYGMCINHVLKERMYLASMAGIDYSLYNDKRGFYLEVHGFNEKLHLAMDEITRTISYIDVELTENQFKMFVDKLKHYYIDAMSSTEVLNSELRREIVLHNHWSTYSLIHSLDRISFNQLRSFITIVFKELKIKALIQGNMTEDNAKYIIGIVSTNLGCGKIENTTKIELRTHQLPLGSNYFICKSFKVNDPRTTVSNFYQIGPNTIRKSCLTELYAAMIQQPLIDMLYTKEKLGFHVWCTPISDNGIIGIQIGVNSYENKINANVVEERIETFRQQAFKLLKKLDEKQYDKIRDLIIQRKLAQPKDLHEEINRNWQEISIDEYLFDRNEQEINCLRKLRKSDLITFLESYEKNNVRKLSIQVVGSKTIGGSQSKIMNGLRQIMSRTSYNLKKIPASKTTISKISDFKKNLTIYPIVTTENE